MNTLAYIAACEADSPNSPDFESLHNFHRDKYMHQACKVLRAKIFSLLNDEGAIDDEQFCELVDAINGCDPFPG